MVVICEDILGLLNEDSKNTGLHILISTLLNSFRLIGNNMRNCEYSSSQAGTQNTFGDHQLHVDIQTDEESRLVKVAASEENPRETACGGSGFSVSFDPLDGSSIVDVNMAVGTIVGIFRVDTLLKCSGRDLAASLISVYGPRVTAALAIDQRYSLSGESMSLELTMLPDRWVISIPKFKISSKAKTFAPGNLRAIMDNPKYFELVNYWITNKYTLRYSGGLVPDVYHILIKGEGVLSNASSLSAKAKLRLLFEAIPIALIIEAAGGSSCVSPSEFQENMIPSSLLDVTVDDLDQRVGVCYGSSDEVLKFKTLIFS